jgi:nucleoside-diphosphate-sugar epimerase
VRVAVLGAGGQIASRVLLALKRHNFAIPVAICRSPVIAERIAWELDCEIRIDAETSAAALAGCDAVINLTYAPGVSSTDREQTRRMIERIGLAVRDGSVRRYIHLSSIAVYGSILHPNRTSTFEHPSPDGLYGVDKLEAEHIVSRTFGSTQARWYNIRLGAAYGTGQQTSRDFLGLLGAPGFAIPFGGAKASNAIHIDVLSRSLVDLATTGDLASGTYNIADFPRTSLGQVFEWHSRLSSLPMPPSMSDEVSLNMAAVYCKQSSTFGLGNTVASALTDVARSVSSAVGGDAVKSLASRLARKLPSVALARMKEFATRRQIAAAKSPSPLGPSSPGLFSEAMPGPYADSVVARGDNPALIVSSEAEFRLWYESWCAPIWSDEGPAPFWISRSLR